MSPRLNLLSHLALALTMTGFYSFSPTYADTPAQHEAQLQVIRKKIQAIAQKIDREQSSKNILERELKSLEAELNSTYREIRTLDTNIKSKQAALAQLQTKHKTLSAELATHKSRLADHVRAAYMTGHQEQIRLILNQTNPATLNRALMYYQYFNRARMSLIYKVQQALAEITQVSEAIRQETATLNILSDQKILLAGQLETDKYKRSRLLKNIKQQIQNENLRIHTLKADEKRIQTLLQSLSDLMNDIPDTKGSTHSFARLKGELIWPTKGTVTHRFGESRGGSDLVWQGISIATQIGQDIRAVSNGRIAFADGLQGFGLIVIIDHQDGYMSLYAHNESLHKDTGDWVESGEVIARAGISGGLTDSMLYFEIRHQGTPINPEKWLKRTK